MGDIVPEPFVKTISFIFVSLKKISEEYIAEQGIFTKDKASQLAKALLSMYLILSGIIKLLRLKQSEKAPLPILIMLSGRTKVVKLSQCQNESLLMCVTPSGIVSVFIYGFAEKAYLPKDVTLLSLIVAGIFKSASVPS